jgi:uncharacterized membrane protein
LPIVDAGRGLAIVQMVAYHLCYDLHYFGWIHIAMTRDPAWIAWRSAIVAQFLFLAGVSLALRAAPGAPGAGGAGGAGRNFWRRWFQIAGCAALVSLASYALFGPRFIWFGVLHFVAVAQLLLTPLARLRPIALLAGAVAAATAGLTIHLAPFDGLALSWIGFAPHKPPTEDYVPLFPWLGAMLMGMAAAAAWRRSAGADTRALRVISGGAWRWPQVLGRWPLTIYMLHQPVLLGTLDLVAIARRSLG